MPVLSLSRPVVTNYARALVPLLNLDTAKTLLLCYILLTRIVKIQRHLRARGISSSIRDVYLWISKVRSGLYHHSSSKLINAVACYTASSAHAEHAQKCRIADESSEARHYGQVGAKGAQRRSSLDAARKGEIA